VWDDVAALAQVTAATHDTRLAVLERQLASLPYQFDDPERYTQMVVGGFLELYTKGVDDHEAAQRSEQKYLVTALANPDRLSVRCELYAVLRLRANFSSVNPPPSYEDREKLSLWFHAWRRMEASIDRNFTYPSTLDSPEWAKLPSESVAPMESGGYSGMLPEQVRDEKLRRDYIKAIEENRKRGDELSLQLVLRDTKKRFLRRLETFIAEALRARSVTEDDVTSKLATIQDISDKGPILVRISSRKAHRVAVDLLFAVAELVVDQSDRARGEIVHAAGHFEPAIFDSRCEDRVKAAQRLDADLYVLTDRVR
jgi:hypothetical protein